MAPDTIVAQATPGGASARAVVRVCGPESWPVVARFFRAACPEPLPRTRAVHAGDFLLQRGTRVPARVWTFVGPRSFSGEDLIELHLPGAPRLLSEVVAQLQHAGARIAEPGEFTRRAFLNGRIDLTQAEGIAALIRARSDGERRHALALLDGGLRRLVEELREEILALQVPLELSFDFSDQDVEAILPKDLDARLCALVDRVRELGQSAASPTTGELPRVVLSGAPNAGKSSLFNALLEDEEALVTSTPGTTRDVLSASLRLGDRELWLLDTAGVEAPRDAAEAEAQKRARHELKSADLILDVRDVRVPRSEGKPPGDGLRLRIATHADLRQDEALGADEILVSLRDGSGLERLRAEIVALLEPGTKQARGLLDARHAEAFQETLVVLGRASELSAHEDAELLASDLIEARALLGRVLGVDRDDALLDRIFSSFCIGK